MTTQRQAGEEGAGLRRARERLERMAGPQRGDSAHERGYMAAIGDALRVIDDEIARLRAIADPR
jgi:hypothetical protein